MGENKNQVIQADEKQPPYFIERDFSALFSSFLPSSKHRKLCIVTDSNVGPLYLGEVRKLAQENFAFCTDFSFEAGEENKNTATVERLYEHLIHCGFDRKDLLLALGGGVVGDLTGFVAATYLRGIGFIQVPTTLLAQVDSSIGGKTGVDFLQYKNMVGAFHMPLFTYVNLSTLKTLPKREFFSGMAEVIKHGLIKDKAYLSFLSDLSNQQNIKQISDMDLQVLEELVKASYEIKNGVVERDPKEQGERALLNFGHTIGHAIEKLSGFALAHGECVALGMVAASYLSKELGNLSQEQFLEIERLIQAYHLPTKLVKRENHKSFADEFANEIFEATKKDKKMDSGKIRYVLLKQPGEAYVSMLEDDMQLLGAIRYLL